MNILLVSSVVVLAIGINLVVFLKFHCDIKQFHCNIRNNSIIVSKKWRILRWNSIVVYKKPPSAPYVAFLGRLTPFMSLLAGIVHDLQKKKIV